MGVIIFGKTSLLSNYPIAILLIVFFVTGCGTSLLAQTHNNYKFIAQPHFRINQADSALMVYIPPEESLTDEDEKNNIAAHLRLRWSFEKQKFVKLKRSWGNITKKGFWIYNTTVTVAQYRRFCGATGREMPPAPMYGWILNSPITNITFRDASDYCAWAGGHLPSLVNWDIALRAGNGGIAGQSPVIFVSGSIMPTQQVGTCVDAFFGDDEFTKKLIQYIRYKDINTTAIALPFYMPDNVKFYNMAKVPEWCTDWFITYQYRKFLMYDPRGSKNTSHFIFTGGVFDATPPLPRMIRKPNGIQATSGIERGFRCVME